MLAAFTHLVFPNMDASYLADDQYGAISLKSVAGIWAIIVALVSSILLAVAVNVLAVITGSASGGMSIALSALGEQFADMGNAQGISMGLMHRVTALSYGGFDALPHNGAVITLLGICR